MSIYGWLNCLGQTSCHCDSLDVSQRCWGKSNWQSLAPLLVAISMCQSICPDTKVHVAHMGPTVPGGSHVGPTSLAIRVVTHKLLTIIIFYTDRLYIPSLCAINDFIPQIYGHMDLGQHWFRQWLVAGQATSHYLNQCFGEVLLVTPFENMSMG